MTDEDIYAFNPVPPKPTPPPRAARRLWPWLVGGLVLLALLVAAGGAVALLALVDATHHGLNITLNGEPWDPIWIDPPQGALAVAGVTAGLLVALLVLLLVLPMTVLLALLAAGLGVGIALLAVLLVAAVALSPLWLLGLVLWLLLRRRPAPTAKVQA